jgi:hypothetical protein
VTPTPLPLLLLLLLVMFVSGSPSGYRGNMRWTSSRYFMCIALLAAPFLMLCSRPAQPTADDRAAIDKLGAHLRTKEGLGSSHSDVKWLVASAGAAGSGRNTAHIPILQIGGVKEAAAQDRILDEVRKWPDKSRFNAVSVHFYGDPKDPADPSSALLNMIRHQRVELR